MKEITYSHNLSATLLSFSLPAMHRDYWAAPPILCSFAAVSRWSLVVSAQSLVDPLHDLFRSPTPKEDKNRSQQQSSIPNGRNDQRWALFKTWNLGSILTLHCLDSLTVSFSSCFSLFLNLVLSMVSDCRKEGGMRGDTLGLETLLLDTEQGYRLTSTFFLRECMVISVSDLAFRMPLELSEDFLLLSWWSRCLRKSSYETARGMELLPGGTKSRWCFCFCWRLEVNCSTFLCVCISGYFSSTGPTTWNIGGWRMEYRSVRLTLHPAHVPPVAVPWCGFSVHCTLSSAAGV